MVKKPDDYEVGYKKPPRSGQFPPGVSGNKGRRKRPESQAEIIARIRDEVVEVNGRRVTKFELAVAQTFNQTIRSGKPRELTALLELLDKYGAMPEPDRLAEQKDAADKVMDKVMTFWERTNNIDSTDVAEVERLEREEAQLVIGCSHCAPVLKEMWKQPERIALAKRYGRTALHQIVEKLFNPERK